jgi:tRNA(Ile)-lysidine synthase
VSKKLAGALPATFAQALDALRVQAPASSIAIAYSGGLDSSALLHLAFTYCQQHAIKLFAFHVNHGISPNASAWQAHCAQQCAALGITFDAREVTVEKSKFGTEAAARKLRYRALGDMCAQHDVALMLTAHHLDDQAETVLLQLLRGSGTAGLSGMDAANAAPELLGNPTLVMARPLLPASRGQLEEYVAAHQLTHIDDESNSDPRFARNALRHNVLPALAKAFPGFQQRFARSAAHAQSAQRLLAELAEQDLKACLVDDCIDVAQLRAMSADRSTNMLRHWFGVRGLSMPSTAWLSEMLTQLLEAKHDAQLCVTHPECHVRRYRDRLHITPHLAELAGQRDEEVPSYTPGHAFRWQGEVSMAFPAYGGTLHFELAEEGFDPAWLRTQALEIDFRKGGERLKPAHNRPTRALKYHYQACNVPAWERERLPIVTAGKDLLFAAGIGMDCHHLSAGPGDRIRLRWS